MKKFISIWSIFAVLSAAVAIDFYIAIHENENPTGEQLLVSCFVIVFFTIFSLVAIGTHIEENKRKKKEVKDTIEFYKTFNHLKGKTYEEIKGQSKLD